MPPTSQANGPWTVSWTRPIRSPSARLTAPVAIGAEPFRHQGLRSQLWSPRLAAVYAMSPLKTGLCCGSFTGMAWSEDAPAPPSRPVERRPNTTP